MGRQERDEEDYDSLYLDAQKQRIRQSKNEALLERL